MLDFLKKNVLFTVLAALIILGIGMYSFDCARAKTFKIEVLSVSPEEPVADGETPVVIKVKLTRNGASVSGHYLYMLPLNGGTMQANRVKTDENGCAEYVYYPYRATVLMPAKRVTIRVYDEDNSVFMVVNACKDFEIELKEQS